MFIKNYEYKYALHVSDALCVHPVAAITVYSAPEDGRKGRPKHVEHTCSFLIITILPELHLVGLLYIIL